MQLTPIHWSWGLSEMLSGLWHHQHCSVHPLKNTVVRMPGPSSVDIRIISRTVPVISLPVSAVFIVIPQNLLWLIRAITSSWSSLPTVTK